MKNSPRRGVTLLEILLAMTILALVAGGFFTAFSVSRRIQWLSETQIMVQNHCQQMMEGLRLAVAGAIASGPLKGLTLTPGIYVDENMEETSRPAGATTLAALNFPTELRRFQNPDGNHPEDGVYLYVERADEGPLVNGTRANPATDYDGDGLKGVDFNNVGKTDLRRVRVKVKWTVPGQ